LLIPWTNTSPSVVIVPIRFLLLPVDNYCGWLERQYQGSDASIDVFFKQTIGKGSVHCIGLSAGNQICLDSIFALGDTVWIKPNPYPTGFPALYSKFLWDFSGVNAQFARLRDDAVLV
jgi:uncharacterized Fe-S cluster protein YjdI